MLHSAVPVSQPTGYSSSSPRLNSRLYALRRRRVALYSGTVASFLIAITSSLIALSNACVSPDRRPRIPFACAASNWRLAARTAHDRASAVAGRDSCPPASAPARRRFARLAESEARAIARGVTGDERHKSVRIEEVAGKSTSVSSRPTARGSSGSANALRCCLDRPPHGGLKVANACCSSD